MRFLLALGVFGIAIVGASMIRDGYRDGTMAPFLFNNLNNLTFRRDTAPSWFFGTMVVNVIVVMVFALGGIALLAAGPR